MIIVSFHNVGHGLPVVLTLIGWGLVLKSFIYFVFPKLGVKMLARVTMDKSWGFVVAGRVFAWHQRLADIFTIRKVRNYCGTKAPFRLAFFFGFSFSL